MDPKWTKMVRNDTKTYMSPSGDGHIYILRSGKVRGICQTYKFRKKHPFPACHGVISTKFGPKNGQNRPKMVKNDPKMYKSPYGDGRIYILRSVNMRGICGTYTIRKKTHFQPSRGLFRPNFDQKSTILDYSDHYLLGK